MTWTRDGVRRTWFGLSLLLSVLSALPAVAAPNGLIEEPESPSVEWCEKRKLGTWFYCPRPKPVEKEEPQSEATAPAASAVERLDGITEHLRELKARAILEPTSENITAYVRFQREQLDRSSTFSDMWQRALWQQPELDYTLERPVSTLGKQVFQAERDAEREQALVHIGQRYGVFYFFASNCGACKLFSPILKSVASSHHMTVMAVSTDGGPSEIFADYVVDSGQRERMGVTSEAVPAVVLFDAQTRQTVPIGFGLLSAEELMERIFVLTMKEVGRDY